MGFTTFIGMVVSFATIIIGIVVVGGDLGDFLDVPSIMMTVIPTFAGAVSTFPLTLLIKIPSHMGVLIRKQRTADQYITLIVDLAKKSRAGGLLSLENEDTGDNFIQYALRMVVDGIDEVVIRDSLEESISALNERHAEPTALYEKLGAYAPAFGMCGTVVSLVNMLMGLDFSDPSAVNRLGANMAAALITTLYGSVLANIVFIPIAARLKFLHKREVFCKIMISNGILAIQRGEKPNIIQESLMQQLDEKTQKALEKAGGGGGGSGEKK